MNVLIIEDNKADQRILQEAFRMVSLDVAVHFVQDGFEADRFLRREGAFKGVPRPRLILLDLNMPKKDGKEFLAEIKSNEDLKTIPVIIFTSSTSEAEIDLCYRLGASGYVVKPTQFRETLDLIEAIYRFWIQKNVYVEEPSA